MRKNKYNYQGSGKSNTQTTFILKITILNVRKLQERLLKDIAFKSVRLANSPENVRRFTRAVTSNASKYTLKYHLYGTQFNIYIIDF